MKRDAVVKVPRQKVLANFHSLVGALIPGNSNTPELLLAMISPWNQYILCTGPVNCFSPMPNRTLQLKARAVWIKIGKPRHDHWFFCKNRAMFYTIIKATL